MGNREDAALPKDEQSAREEEALDQALLASPVFQAAADGILVVDEHGAIRAVNPAARRTFGFPGNELLGAAFSLLVPETRAEPPAEQPGCGPFGPGLGIGGGQEVSARHKDGSCFPLYLSIGEFRCRGRRLFACIVHPGNGQLKLAERVTFLASYDALTGCLNRHQMLQTLEQTLRSCQAGDRRLAVLFIDLDGFKRINDNHGHGIGDRLLGEVARRFQKSLRESDVLGRMGGDEFVACISLDGQPGLAEEVGRRLIESLAPPFDIDGIRLCVGASIGISLFPAHGVSAEKLIEEADTAMYRAKLLGGGGLCVFSRTLREQSERRYRLVDRLREAVSLQQFEAHYQLQFDLRTLQPSGIEALPYWRDGGRGLVPPAQFLPIAAECGLLAEIDLWLLRQACADNARLIEQGLLDVAVAVNVCAPLFGAEELLQWVRRILDDACLPADRLELEITEEMTLSASPQVPRNALGLIESGVGLTLDGFGEGRCSLARLHQLQLDKLKIDRAIVAVATSTEHAGVGGDGGIIQAILGIARSLGMQAVAEGIETRAQLEYLRAQGCRWGQGSWFAQAMSFAELSGWLRAPR